ncbi:MAG: lytic transglycosylase domain-containing protein [Candidatus Aminicenantes bacterium]
MKSTGKKGLRVQVWRPVVAVILLIGLLTTLGLEASPVLGLKHRYDQIIQNAARKYGVPADLIHSIIGVESNYNCWAVSSKGAKGLMQLMPETAKRYGVKDVYDPQENIEGGVKYLRDLIQLYHKKRDLVLAAYNAGQEAVKKYGGIPPYQETRDYIKKISRQYQNPVIRGRTRIYTFYDESGRLILTNTPYRFSSSRGENR